MKKGKNHFINIILLLSFLLGTPAQRVRAASAISLDGAFADWNGQPCVNDPQSDAGSSNDLLNFCFVGDQAAERVYFMVERGSDGNSPLKFSVRLDMNDDGDYSDAQDRSIYVVYNPNNNSTKVDVIVYDGSGSYINTVASGADWGVSGLDGASKVEFFASFADLGLVAGVSAAITMDIVTYQGNNVDDYLNTPIQWTPANALGYVILGGIVFAAFTWFSILQARKQKSISK